MEAFLNLPSQRLAQAGRPVTATHEDVGDAAQLLNAWLRQERGGKGMGVEGGKGREEGEGGRMEGSELWQRNLFRRTTLSMNSN